LGLRIWTVLAASSESITLRLRRIRECLNTARPAKFADAGYRNTDDVQCASSCPSRSSENPNAGSVHEAAVGRAGFRWTRGSPASPRCDERIRMEGLAWLCDMPAERPREHGATGAACDRSRPHLLIRIHGIIERGQSEPHAETEPGCGSNHPSERPFDAVKHSRVCLGPISIPTLTAR
jgi:hypothetical protein